MIFLDDTPGLTPLQLRTKCRRLHAEYNLDLVLVDYLQLMSSGCALENRVQEVSYISRNMKILARELNVPVLAAAQLSRAVEQRADKEPQLSDLRESGSLEQDADIVMFINRPELYDKDTLLKNVAQIKIAKHRNGPVGQVELVFRSNIAKFENAATYQVNLGGINGVIREKLPMASKDQTKITRALKVFRKAISAAIALPQAFFRQLLPQIDHLGELKSDGLCVLATGAGRGSLSFPAPGRFPPG